MAYVRSRQLPERPTKRHPLPKSPDKHVVELVMARAVRDGDVCCEVCARVVWGTRAWDYSIHHRRRRDGRPDMNSPANLLLVCGASNVDACHGRIHQRRSESQPAGWWISRIAKLGGAVADPLTIPVLIDRESRWVYLNASGGYADRPPDGVL